MDDLQSRHRKELRDLQSRVTQKKKQASKKTRKAVNDECERLERELKERHEREVKEVNGEAVHEQEEDGISGEMEDLTLRVDNEKGEEQEQTTNGVEPSEEDAPSQAGGGVTGKKRNRAKERLARRAAEQQEMIAQAQLEAQDIPDLQTQERTRILSAMKEKNLTEFVIRADGHCLYSAVADQLAQLEIPLAPDDDKSTVAPYKTVRAAAASYIHAHPESFVPFLEEPLETYVAKIRDTAEWGGQLELLALAKTYGVDINVLQDFGRIEKIEAGGAGDHQGEVWVGYYKHGFGLGEHYNSLRRKGQAKEEGG